MPRTTTPSGIEIEYRTDGDPDDVPLLLVMGLGAQLIRWSDDFVAEFVDRGFFAIRYDNRDTGLSTHLDGVEVDLGALLGGGEAPVPYVLSDMADDGLAVLDALGIAKAHVLGASMGGMIVQTMAIEHPERLASVTSIMSTTGDPDVGLPSPDSMNQLLAPPPATRDEAMDREVLSAQLFGSVDFLDEERLRATAAAAWDRNVDPAGVARHLAAILASGSRSEALRHVDLPFLVVHGDIDNLVSVTGGRRTAEVVPGATYLEIERMGHDLVPQLWGQVVSAVTSMVQDVETAASA